MPPRHGLVVTLLGYTAMTVGLCLVLQPTPGDVAIAAGLGTLVGVMVLAARGRQALAVLVPVLAAIVVSALSFEAVKHGIADPGLRTLIAPLVTFLPGGVLTTATVELASGEMVAGASRLVFGERAACSCSPSGSSPASSSSDSRARRSTTTRRTSSAGGRRGSACSCSASPRRSSSPLRAGRCRWLLLVLLAAWLGQVLGDRLVGAHVSGFFGALAMTPVALAIAQTRVGPPSQVTFLPAFWLLVPGALGLIGVTEIVGDPATASIEDLVEPIGAIISIALGVLAGVSLYRGLITARPLHRLGVRA